MRTPIQILKENRKTKSNKFLSLILIFTVFISCDCVHNYTYQVTNETNSAIKIEWQNTWTEGVTIISPNKTENIFHIEHGIEACKRCPCFDDVKNDITKLTISKNDSLTSSENYISNDKWTFENGTYHTLVTDIEFE